MRGKVRALGVVLAVGVLLPATGAAQRGTDTAVDANLSLRLAGPSDLTRLRTTRVTPAGDSTIALYGGVAFRPLVLDQGRRQAAAVAYTAYQDLSLAISPYVDGLQIGAAFPLALVQEGLGIRPLVEADEARGVIDVILLRDPRFHVDYRVLERGDGRPGLLVSAAVTAPLGDDGAFAGHDQVMMIPGAVADLRAGPVLVAVDLSARLLLRTREVGAASLGSMVVVGVGAAYVGLEDRLTASVEGSAVVQLAEQPDEATREQHAYELSVGLRYVPEQARSYAIVTSVGAGIGGFGAPRARLEVGFEYGFNPLAPPEE